MLVSWFCSWFRGSRLLPKGHRQPDTEYPIEQPVSRLSRFFKFSVPFRLNLINVFLLVSGLVSVAGVYELQYGSDMHKLSLPTGEYTRQIVAHVNAFKEGEETSASIREVLVKFKDLPSHCINAAGIVERVVTNAFGTFQINDIGQGDVKTTGSFNIINLCQQGLIQLDHMISQVDAYDAGSIDRETFETFIEGAVVDITIGAVEFTRLVDSTFVSVFTFVLFVVVTKALVFPIFGFFLAMGVSKDYRELGRTKSKLIDEREKNEVIQAEKMTALSTMVAGVAHEINTPVGVGVTAVSYLDEIVVGIKEDYAKGDLTEESLHTFLEGVTESTRILQTNLTRASQLVKSFKQVSVDQTIDQSREVVVRDYLDDILMSLAPRLKATNLEITVDCPGDLKVDLCPGAFSQVVANLLTNSLVHAYDEGQVGHIHMHAGPGSGGGLVFAYKDDGKGIPEDMISKIYDPFVTTKRGQGGTGLGLHIVHNLVTDKLNGTIQCDSTLGKGVKFLITLPDSSMLK